MEFNKINVERKVYLAKLKINITEYLKLLIY